MSDYAKDSRAALSRTCLGQARPVSDCWFETHVGLALTVTALLCAFCLSGCVTRRLTIRSNPPGALVYVDDYKIGTTPISHNFIYYGTRKIRLIKDGYETLTLMQSIPPPWYEIPPLDFISENFVPGELRDHRTITYQLTPQRVARNDQLLARAEDLRGQVQSSRSMVIPSAASPPLTTPSASPLPGPPPGNAVPRGEQPFLPPGQVPQTPESLPTPEPLGFGPRSATPYAQPQPTTQPGYVPPGLNRP